MYRNQLLCVDMDTEISGHKCVPVRSQWWCNVSIFVLGSQDIWWNILSIWVENINARADGEFDQFSVDMLLHVCWLGGGQGEGGVKGEQGGVLGVGDDERGIRLRHPALSARLIQVACYWSLDYSHLDRLNSGPGSCCWHWYIWCWYCSIWFSK